VSDRLDGRLLLPRAVALVAAAAALACQPAVPLPDPPPVPIPCTRDVAVASDTIVVSGGICNPYCIHVPVGTTVYFLNSDPALYLFVADPPLPYDVQVPGYAGAETLPLAAAGTMTWTAVQQPAATATVFVE
jgi:hypothetical protein